jgi:hypothetical protein
MKKSSTPSVEKRTVKKEFVPVPFSHTPVPNFNNFSSVDSLNRNCVINNVGEDVIKNSQCPYFSDTNLMHVSHIKEIMRNLGKDDILNSKSICEGVDILYDTAKKIRGY